MDIQLSQQLEVESDWKTFICDLIIDGLSAAAAAFAPELAPVGVFEDIDFDAACAQLDQSSS